MRIAASPRSLSVDSFVPAMLIWIITGYQRWLSPRKGFRCAHHACHQRGPCSFHAKRVLRRGRPWRAVRLIHRRLLACRDAAHAIRAGDILFSTSHEAGGGEDTRATDGKQKKKKNKESKLACCADGACHVGYCTPDISDGCDVLSCLFD